MRCAVWFSNYGLPTVSYSLPYDSRSPVSFTKVRFETEKDVLDEISKVLNERGTKKFGIGQSLFYQLPFFCDPVQIISTWCWDMITDYFTVTKFHIPLARDLDSLNPWQLDCFLVIENEITNITTHEREKNGN